MDDKTAREFMDDYGALLDKYRDRIDTASTTLLEATGSVVYFGGVIANEALIALEPVRVKLTVAILAANGQRRREQGSISNLRRVDGKGKG